MKAQNHKPSGWQINFAMLDSDKIQYWTNGIMITLVTLKEAQEMVSNHQAFVISGEAIGQLDENGYSIA